MICDQEIKGSTGTLTMDDIRKEVAEEAEKEIRERLETYSDPYLKPADFKRWEKYVNHLISEGKSFETIVQEIRFEKMGDQKVLQEELEAMKHRRWNQEMDEAYEKAKEKAKKKEIENIAKEEDDNKISLEKSQLCAECREEYKDKACEKCGFPFCYKCFEGHSCAFDSHKEEKEEIIQSSYSIEKIKDIVIAHKNHRNLNNNTVNELLCSIEKIGLLNPITITKDKKLIAGFHRIHAFLRLGREEIPCRIVEIEGLKAELAEIDENLMRNEFDYIARGDQLARRKKIYEELYPDTKKGAINQYTKVLKPESGDSKNTSSFVEDTARKTGKSKTVIKEELQISNNVIPEAKEVIKEKKIPKQKALKVARMTPEEQKHIMEQVKAGKDIDEVLGEEKQKEVKTFKEIIDEKFLSTLIPEAKEILKEKNLPKTNAIQLSRMEPEEQKIMVERIKSGEAKNVQEAMSIDYFARKEEEPLPEEKLEEKKEPYDPLKPYVPDTEEEAKARKERSKCELFKCLKELLRMKEDYEVVKFFNFYKHARCYFSSEKDFGKVAQAGHEIQKRLKEIDGYIEEFREILR